MDVVITYVNGLDPLWQDDYVRSVGKKALKKRYRDWGTLPYLLRGIEKCMPFVENVFLVVARESQVPEGINRNNLHVVLHEDFIPQEFLPTFNSTAIEMFLHRIKGLSEQYIYFNDDFFPVKECSPTDFFRDGKAAVNMRRHLCTLKNLFRIQTRRACTLARKTSKKGFMIGYYRPQHTCAPMLRSVCEELYEKCKDEIHASISSLRETKNLNQYLYTDYAFFTGRTFNKRISNQHISLSITRPNKLRQYIVHPTHNIVCINDVEMSEDRYHCFHQAMHEAFSARFPDKSKYEE